MLTIRNILFPTDFSPKTSRALDFSIDLALAHKARLHILHVVEPITDDPPITDNGGAELDAYYQSAVSAANEWMDPLVARAIRRDCQLPVRIVLRGEIARSIVGYATAKDVDVIVLPYRTERVPGVHAIGTHVGSIVRSAPCPVLTFKDAVIPRSIRRLSDIVVGVDFSTYSRLAVEYGARIARAYGARLHAIHVVARHNIPACYAPAEGELRRAAARDQSSSYDALQYFIKEMDLLDVPISVAVTVDNPPYGITDYAREAQAGLVVLGTHGQSGYTVAGPGNVAAKVVRLAHCPVLSVRHKKRQLVRKSSVLELTEDGTLLRQ